MAAVDDGDLVESDDYYAWLGLSGSVSCLCIDCCFHICVTNIEICYLWMTLLTILPDATCNGHVSAALV